MRLNSAICAIALVLAGPAMALPGPLRLAEVDVPKQAPVQRSLDEYAASIVGDDMFVLASAKLALQKSKSAELRKFATLLITSHTASGNQLKLTLARSSAHPVLPTMLDSTHVAIPNQLKGASGAEFDTRYIQQMIDSHEWALELHQSYARRGEDMGLKHFATEAEARVALHLAEAQKISHSLGGLQPRA